MDTFGRHLLAEYHGCESELLNNKEKISDILQQAAEAAKATIVKLALHTFLPQGVSGVVIIEESHISIHTWPEKGYAAVDFYTCGDCIPINAHNVLIEKFKPSRYQLMTVHRGIEGKTSMELISDEMISLES